MPRTFISIAAVFFLILGSAFSVAQAEQKTFYWVSHGSPADPVWVYFLSGAQEWAKDTGNTVKTSFHSGDVASQQSAVRSAIASHADGIVTTNPAPRSMTKLVKAAHEAGIPIVNINTPAPKADFDAYVGTNNVKIGRMWAQYLVDHDLVEKGDFVWMPVEVPGATYAVQEKKGIVSVFKPLGIKWKVTDTSLDQSQIISNMTYYLTAHHKKIDAIIGLGDLVMGSVKRVFDRSGVEPGEIPVVGWGNTPTTAREVLNGYANAAASQEPAAISYMGLSIAAMEASGIRANFDIHTGSLYEEEGAQRFLKKHFDSN